jgi:hypothetical protein
MEASGGSTAQSATETTGGTQSPPTSGSGGATAIGGTSAIATTSSGTSPAGIPVDNCMATPSCSIDGRYLLGGPVTVACQNDSGCLAGEYCDHILLDRPNCVCQGPAGNRYWAFVWDGGSGPISRFCSPASCNTPISSVFTSQLGGNPCDVVVRVNADGSTILGYKVVCGAGATVSQGALQSTLQSTSGATWQGAMGYGDTSKHFLFVDNSNPNHAIAFSGVTGLQLFEFSDATTPTVLGDWSNASELDGSCNYGFDVGSFVTLGPWQSSYPGSSVVKRIVQQGVFSGISTASGGERSITLVHAGLPDEEYFVIISTSPRT